MELIPTEARSNSAVVVDVILNLIPVVGGAVASFTGEIEARHRDRIAHFGSKFSAQQTEALLARLQADERFGDMFVRAATQIAFTAWAPKRQAMGQVVLEALDGNDSTIDDSEVVLQALITLEAAQFKALAILSEMPHEENIDGVLLESVPWLTPQLHAPLLAVGAIQDIPGWDDKVAVRTTDFAERLLDLVTA
jgi:hypothetical protein